MILKISYVKQILVFSSILIFISACGYRPSSKQSRSVLGEKISTSIIISAQDPENTVIIKDAVDGAIVETLQASLTSKERSDSHLVISISTPSYSPIQYDSNGYIISYRMSVHLTIMRYHNGAKKSYGAVGTYDFNIAQNAVVTDQERFDAIKFSAAKAINSFIAQLSAEGARREKE